MEVHHIFRVQDVSNLTLTPLSLTHTILGLVPVSTTMPIPSPESSNTEISESEPINMFKAM